MNNEIVGIMGIDNQPEEGKYVVVSSKKNTVYLKNVEDDTERTVHKTRVINDVNEKDSTMSQNSTTNTTNNRQINMDDLKNEGTVSQSLLISREITSKQ